MAIDIKREIARKDRNKYVDEIIKELHRSPDATPFDVQILDQCFRRFLHLLDDARFRGDNPDRITAIVSAVASDMIAELVMRMIPPSEPGLAYNLAQRMLNETSNNISDLLAAYIQAPPKDLQ